MTSQQYPGAGGPEHPGDPYANQPRPAGGPPHYPPPPPPPQPPCNRGWGSAFLQSCLVAGCVSILAPVLLFLLLVVIVVYGASSAIPDGSGTLEAYTGVANIRERVIRKGAVDAGTIALVTLDGVIAGNGSPIEGDGKMAWVADQLKAARENPAVKAVILQIDSPGGGLTASDLLYNEVKRVKAAGKKVIVWAGGLMASGGYYVGVAADGIMASPTSTVGSIGVIMQHYELAGLLDKIGAKADPIVAGSRKDIGSPFREMTPDERKYLQDFVDSSHARFIDLVAENRDMPREKAAKLADGGVFTATEALDNGLVDRIGYMEDAIAWTEKQLEASDMRIISYRRLLSFSDLFGEVGRGAAKALLEEGEPRAMAIWDGRRAGE